jgi:hypothetical protein
MTAGAKLKFVNDELPVAGHDLRSRFVWCSCSYCLLARDIIHQSSLPPRPSITLSGKMC